MKKIKKVMLIDDSIAVNNRNQSLLQGMGYFEKFVKCSSTSGAIDYLRNNLDEKETALPELIFLDISMPEKDGFDFLDQYIELEEVAKANYSPVIAIVSDYLDMENFIKSKDYKHYGVLDHIKKPIDQDDIENLIEEHFENS